MGKRLLSICLTLCMLLTLLPKTAWAAETVSGTCGEYLAWTLDSTGTLTISGTGDMPEYSSYSEVPWCEYRERIIHAIIAPGVTSIAPYCFWYDENLKSVSISEGVTQIGAVCFQYCTSLQEIKLPASLNTIEHSAFYNCENLTTVGSIANVSEIGHHAFMNCTNLKNLDLSNLMTTIHGYAFAKCESLVSVGDLSNVTHIMENAFLDCKKLQTINSLAKVTKFNDEAFSGCVSLTSVGEVNSEASMGRNVFYNCSRLVQRDTLDPEASIHDISSDWSVNNASRIGWINIGTCPQDPEYRGKETVKLVNSLCEGLTDDLSKAKALYGWVVNNICYDFDRANRPGLLAWLITDEDRVKLKAAGGFDDMMRYEREDVAVILKRGICDDFSWVYAVMLQLVGISASKQSCEVSFSPDSHACVMAYLDGEWRFFDPTLDANGKYVKERYSFEPSDGNWAYFNMDIQQFSKGHFFSEDVGAIADNTPSDWAKDEVWQAQLSQLAPSNLQSKYRREITREEFCGLMVALIEKHAGQDINEYLSTKGLTPAASFTDTSDPSVLATHVLGIVNGISEKEFKPRGYITRQEAAVMLARTARLLGVTTEKAGSFTDASKFASWAAADISFVSGLTDPTTGRNVMGGIGDGAFDPFARYSREQAILTTLRLFHCAAE